MTSLRRRLLLVIVPGVLVAFALAGLVLATLAHDTLVDELDAGLLARARALGSLFERSGERLEFDYAGQVMTAFEGGPEPEYFEVRYPDGRELVRSPTLGDEHLPDHTGSLSAPRLFDLTLPDGRAGRAVGVLVPVQEDVEPRPPIEYETFRLALVVAVSREALDARLASLGAGLAGAAGLAALLVLFAVGFGVRRALRPVDALADRVARIDADSLDARVGSSDVPNELQPVARRIDELLERLDEAFARQRRMTAAMAHELRTPLAELRAASDVAHRWPDDAALRDDLLRAASTASARLSSTVEAVMRFCRVDAGREASQPRDTSLRALVETHWSGVARRAEARGLRFSDEVADDERVHVDPELLGLVLANLLGNAAEFASAGTIRVTCEAHGPTTLALRVANTASDLHPSDVSRLAEPFWRADTARTGDAHSGFGLTLCNAVARLLDAELHFELVNGVLIASLTGLARAGTASSRTADDDARTRAPHDASATNDPARATRDTTPTARSPSGNPLVDGTR
ncbi:MAG: HAMP domain-containing histidine kinase [Planctomycetes bacterium]|nr:HAMP domain-containing histidine kinase [Planctomycetota bacterium]